MQGLLLGLANGTACVAYCAPVLVPFLICEGRQIKGNYAMLAVYLLGRFAGYSVFSIAAWVLGEILLENVILREMIVGFSYVALAVMLLLQGKVRKGHSCQTAKVNGYIKGLGIESQYIAAMLLGFLTGLNICPPFMLAVTGAVATGTLLGSIIFFTMFFIGTAVYFLPIPLVGRFRSKEIHMIGRMTSIMISVYYIFQGLLKLIGGIYLL